MYPLNHYRAGTPRGPSRGSPGAPPRVLCAVGWRPPGARASPWGSTGPRAPRPAGARHAPPASPMSVVIQPGHATSLHCVTVPFGETINAKPGSSPFPGVVAFWISRTSFTRTLLVTAPVGFLSHEF